MDPVSAGGLSGFLGDRSYPPGAASDRLAAGAVVDQPSGTDSVQRESIGSAIEGLDPRVGNGGMDPANPQANWSAIPPEGVGATDRMQDCQALHLSDLNQPIRIDEYWDRGCDAVDASGATSRLLNVSLNDWAFVRMELVSLDDVSIQLALANNQGVEPVSPSADGVLHGGPNVPEGSTLAWRQDVLGAGTYQVGLLSHAPDGPGRFVFTIHSQPIPPPPLEFTSLSVGYLRSCGLIEGGVPICWGLGIRGTDMAAGQAPFEQISVGVSSIICGLKPEGYAICWGGAGISTHNPAPGQKLVQIDVGSRHICGVQDDAQARCWGNWGYATSSPDPGDVPAGYALSQISVARDYTCGLTTDGAPVCWGDDWNSASMAPADERLVSIAAGERHVCGMRSDGTIACWGSWGMDACFPVADGFNECGGVRGYGIPPLPPEQESIVQLSSDEPHCGLRADGLPVCWTPFASLGLVPPPAQEFESISATATVACGLAADGSAVCWGDDRFGQASPPSGRNATGEVRWPQPQNVVSVSAGTTHVCATAAGGEISCWGPNWWNGRFPDTEKYSDVSSGPSHTCALTSSGGAVCRGNDWLGQSSPPPGLLFDSISVGRNGSCGLKRDGSVVCWGASDPGGTPLPEDMRFKSFDSGGEHACGITFGGEAVCWGRNAEMQVMPVDGTDAFKAVSAGGAHTCYLFDSGSIKCAGHNEYGQTEAPQGPEFVAVSSGGFISCGLHRDGSVSCWGADFLGNVNPPQGETFQSVSAGSRFACGARTNGTVTCWGDVSDGQDMPVRYLTPG